MNLFFGGKNFEKVAKLQLNSRKRGRETLKIAADKGPRARYLHIKLQQHCVPLINVI